MASPLVGRVPTCLSCIRAINQAGSGSIAFTQLRGKKTAAKSKGVVVRLLEDMVKYGKEGSVFRLNPGFMRNQLYPMNKAEYMTEARFKELGMTKADIGERDYQFGVNRQLEEEDIADAVEHIAGLGSSQDKDAAALEEGGETAPGIEGPAIEIEQLAPNRALELMEDLIPQTMIFNRHMIHQPKKEPESEAPKPKEAVAQPAATKAEHAASATPDKSKEILSPLQRRRLEIQQAEVEKARMHPAEAAAEVATDKDKDRPATSPLDVEGEKTGDDVKRERQQTVKDAEEHLKIHGSVSQANIASYMQELMQYHPEASRIQVQAADVKFVGLEESTHQVKKIGSFEVEVRTHTGKAPVEPIMRRVEVVPIIEG